MFSKKCPSIFGQFIPIKDKAALSKTSVDDQLEVTNKIHALKQAHRALTFLSEKTDNESYNCPEEHYLYSDSIAELCCTLTSLPFLGVAWYFQDYPIYAVAFFSILSHIISF